MPDFRSLLSKPVSEIERPPVMPAGTWYGTIKNFKFGESRFDDQTTGEKIPQVSYSIVIQEPGPGVDPEEARKFIGRTVTQDFSIAEDGQWALKVFLEGLGLSSTGKTLDALIPEAQGASVQLIIEHNTSKKDPAIVFANVKKVAKRQ